MPKSNIKGAARVNPAEEFKNDAMMRELHEGKKKRYEILRNMSEKERIDYINKTQGKE
ncbi:MAG: hypothetical protein HY747_08125 [Elusimicrobia bacterium]|nr:hypothetical protein [Elusimicrobiota bacterium]